MCFYVTTTTTSRHFSEEQKKQRIKYYAFIFPFSFYFIRLSSHQIFLCHSYVISFKMSHTHTKPSKMAFDSQFQWNLYSNCVCVCLQFNENKRRKMSALTFIFFFCLLSPWQNVWSTHMCTRYKECKKIRKI